MVPPPRYHACVPDADGGSSLLATRRLRAGLTQEELAELSGLSARSISNIERGRITRPRADSLDRLAGALALEGAARDEFIDHYRGRADRPGAAPNQLPVRQGRFTGRAAYLNRLDQLTAPVLTVDGVGGVGKTALVIEWAHRSGHRFPDGMLYTDLHGYGPLPPADPELVLDGFLRVLGVPGDQVPAGVDARAGLLRSLLTDRRVLIVLDNARTADQVRPLLPGSAGCLAVVTSRRQLRGLSVRDGAQRITVDPLTDAEATALLAHPAGQARVSAEPAAVAAIVHACAGLPLAVNIVGERAARAPHRPLAELAVQLAGTGGRLDALDAGDGDGGSSVREICAWSYDALDPAAARLFRLLGLFPGATFDLAAAAALAGVTEPEAGRTVDLLTGSHLLEQNSAGRWEFHDLLREYAAELAGTVDPADARQAALVRLFDHCLAAARRAIGSDGTPVPGAVAWLDEERDNLVAVAVAAAEQGLPRYAVGLSESLRIHLDASARHQAGQRLHAAAASTPDPVARGRALRYLGTACDRMGRHGEALDHYRAALELAVAQHDQRGECDARNNLGIAYWRLGRHRDAEAQYTRVLAVSEDLGDPVVTSRALGNLGLVYQQLGEYARAADHHRRAAELFGDGPDATDRDNLGTAYRLLGRYDDALRSHHAALAGYRRLGDRNGVSDALCNIGLALQGVGRLAEARAHHEQAHAVAREVGSPLAEAKALNGLGETELLAGDPDAAARRHRQALDTLAALPATAESAHAHDGLARAADAVGDAGTARQHWRSALEQRDHLSAADVAAIRDRLAALA